MAEIGSSSEDYLKNILLLSEGREYIRAIDIARAMDVSKPSVFKATQKLRDEGLIVIDERKITLTDEGRAIAENVYSRYVNTVDLLVSLGVTEEVAREDAHKIEHDLSEETYQAIKDCMESACLGEIAEQR